jgi:hypothetical protein
VDVDERLIWAHLWDMRAQLEEQLRCLSHLERDLTRPEWQEGCSQRLAVTLTEIRTAAIIVEDDATDALEVVIGAESHHTGRRVTSGPPARG